jgi:hypothetical protein
MKCESDYTNWGIIDFFFFQGRQVDVHKDQCCKAMYNRSKLKWRLTQWMFDMSELWWQYNYASSQPYENHKTLTECNPVCLLLVPNVRNNKIDWCCSTHSVIGHLATIYKTRLTLQDSATDPPPPSKKIILPLHWSPTSPAFTFLHFTCTLKSISRSQAVSCLPQQEGKGFIPDLSIQNLWWKHHIRMRISPSTAAFSCQYQCANALCSPINPILTQHNLSNWQHHKIKLFKQDVNHLFTETVNITAFGTHNYSIINNLFPAIFWISVTVFTSCAGKASMLLLK